MQQPGVGGIVVGAHGPAPAMELTALPQLRRPRGLMGIDAGREAAVSAIVADFPQVPAQPFGLRRRQRPALQAAEEREPGLAMTADLAQRTAAIHVAAVGQPVLLVADSQLVEIPVDGGGPEEAARHTDGGGGALPSPMRITELIRPLPQRDQVQRPVVVAPAAAEVPQRQRADGLFVPIEHRAERVIIRRLPRTIAHHRIRLSNPRPPHSTAR
jgi:hypothetical protein